MLAWVRPRRGAAAAALLLAVSAYQVYFGQEARHYVTAALLVQLGYYLLALLLTGEGKRARQWPLWLALALTNAASLYTFYYTAFAIVGLPDRSAYWGALYAPHLALGIAWAPAALRDLVRPPPKKDHGPADEP